MRPSLRDLFMRPIYETYLRIFFLELSLLGKVKLRFNRLASQNYTSIKRALLKKLLEFLKGRIV